MITAKNYAAQSERYMLGLADQLEYSPSDAVVCRKIAALIKSSVHFAVPDNGEILNAGRDVLYETNIKLPFDVITIEYDATSDTLCPKRLVIAAASHIVNQIIPVNFDDGVCVFGVAYATNVKTWCLIPVAAFLPTQFGDYENIQLFKPIPHIYDKLYANDIDTALHDISPDVGAVFELLEALSCKNVEHEPIVIIDPAVNKRRISDGKLPIYETRILTLKQLHTPQKRYGTGSHASPRQHLRRGHIRRLPHGSVWINSCVVGDPTQGRIDKSYKILGGINGNQN